MEIPAFIIPVKTNQMKSFLLSLVSTLLCSCNTVPVRDAAQPLKVAGLPAPTWPRNKVQPGSWQWFLQHLPTQNTPVVDYNAVPIAYQDKAYCVVSYDVGTKDLQQCADAIMRLRAEYLFSQKRYGAIGFHFTDGVLYSFKQYLKGIRPLVGGHRTVFEKTAEPCDSTHANLRRYLDIVYAYAGTISLAKELLPADRLTVGTVIIKGGSPGHCCIVVDEATRATGDKVYKLAEGYTPAQSIYILRNPVDGSPWYALKKDAIIETSSYTFRVYQLGRFE